MGEVLKVFFRLIALLAGYASITGVYLTVYPLDQERSSWEWFFLAVFGGSALLQVFHEIRSGIKNRIRKFSSENKINRYMCKWISQPGRALIFSRDLSWGDKFDTKRVLLQKARKKELRIFLSDHTDLSRALMNEGAEIILYGRSGYEPRSRFTIIGYGQDGGRIAVGTRRNGDQVVHQFESGDDPVFAIAEDFARIISKYNELIDGNP